MTCACHDPAVFGHQQPCPFAAPLPTRIYTNGTLIAMDPGSTK